MSDSIRGCFSFSFFSIFFSSSSLLTSSTSTASSRSQCASPDLNWQLLMAVRGQRRTATASSRLQWASQGFNSMASAGHCWTLTGEAPVAMSEVLTADPSGTAGPQPAKSQSQWALPDSNRQLPITVGTAGHQPPAPDPSGHRRTLPERCQTRSTVRIFAR